MSLEFTELRKMDHLLDEGLAVVVSRMSLAGKDELNGMAGVLDHFHHRFELVENQRCPLVSSKAPSKPDGQRIGVEE